MPRWLMKTDDDEYVEWSTVVDAVVSDVMTRDEAVEAHDEERVRFTDQHLCSCRARLGENYEIRNGHPVAIGGGRLAYHFDSYEFFGLVGKRLSQPGPLINAAIAVVFACGFAIGWLVQWFV
jgi:hypothetical protein